MGIQFLRQGDLPHDDVSNYLVGESFGGANVCVVFFDGAPGEGPRLHRHPTPEVLIVVEGTATFDDVETKRELGAGEMAFVPASQAHAFVVLAFAATSLVLLGVPRGIVVGPTFILALFVVLYAGRYERRAAATPLAKPKG